MLIINKLKKSFSASEKPLLNNLELTLNSAESVSIQGASGCGKSTLLSLIAGFDRPDSGDILIDNLSITKRTKNAHDIDILSIELA